MADFRVIGLRNRALEVTGRWSAATRRAVSLLRPRELELNHAHGFVERDLDFLSDLAGSSVRELTVVDHRLRDVDGIGYLAPQLESLSLRVGAAADLDLTQLPRLKTFAGQWRDIRGSVTAASALQRLFLEGYDGKDLSPLAVLPTLDTIRLERPSALTTLSGLPERCLRFGAVQAPQLVDISALTQAKGLVVLWLIGCRTRDGLETVGRCTRLEELDISGWGSLPSLAPLRDLTLLRRLVMLGSTHVDDGDLSPLLDLPRLGSVSIEPRRHYRPTAAAVFTASRAKPTAPLASWA